MNLYFLSVVLLPNIARCKEFCVDPPDLCAHNTNPLCKRYDTYAGTKNTTVSGKVCQAWNVNTPHDKSSRQKQRTIVFTVSDLDEVKSHPVSLETHNYCRNPDNEDGPWCYTTTSTRWEYCFSNCTSPTLYKTECFDFKANGVVNGSAPISTNNNVSGRYGCAELCEQHPACVAFGYRTPTCILYGDHPNTVGILTEDPTFETWIVA